MKTDRRGLSAVGTLEVGRRVFLLAGVVAWALLWRLAADSPLLRLEAADFQRQQEYYGGSYVDEEERAIRALPLEAFIERVTEDRLVTVEGEEWQGFLAAVAGGGDRWDGVDLSRRAVQSGGDRSVFFRPDAVTLFQDLDEAISNAGPEPYYLRPQGGGWDTAVRMNVISFTDDDFGMGEGLRTYPDPPGSVLYPHRGVGWIALGAGLVFYLLLGIWRSDEPDAFRCARRPLVVGDFLGAGLVGVFLWLGLAVVGSTTLAFTGLLGFTAVVIFLALFGVAILAVDAHHASWSLRFLPEGIEYRTVFRSMVVPFPEIESFSLVDKTPPRWLIRLLWIGALVGRGGLGYTLAGQASMLEGSAAGGMELRLTDGERIFVWLTDQRGEAIVPDDEGMVARLRRAGVREETEA